MAKKPQNCKVEMTRCTINSKNLCIFALRGICFPSKFSVSAVFLVVKGSYTDLHRFDPRRPYSIKTRIKTSEYSHEGQNVTTLADHIPLKQGLRQSLSKHTGQSVRSRRPYSIKTRIKTPPACDAKIALAAEAVHLSSRETLHPLMKRVERSTPCGCPLHSPEDPWTRHR